MLVLQVRKRDRDKLVLRVQNCDRYTLVLRMRMRMQIRIRDRHTLVLLMRMWIRIRGYYECGSGSCRCKIYANGRIDVEFMKMVVWMRNLLERLDKCRNNRKGYKWELLVRHACLFWTLGSPCL